MIAKDDRRIQSEKRWEREKQKGRRRKRKTRSPVYPLLESQKNIILHASRGRSLVAKQAHSSVTIFPLWNWGRDEERIALFPISLLLLVTHSSRRPIDLNFTRSFLSALPQCHQQPFIHNCRLTKFRQRIKAQPQTRRSKHSPGEWIRVKNLFAFDWETETLSVVWY